MGIVYDKFNAHIYLCNIAHTSVGEDLLMAARGVKVIV